MKIPLNLLIKINLGVFIMFFVCQFKAFAKATDVYVDKSKNVLMVTRPNGEIYPFVIKGLSWSPATKAPLNGPNPLNPAGNVQYGFFFNWEGRNPQGNEVLNYWLKNELSANSSVDIPLMRQMNVNTVRIYHSLGSSVEDYAVIKQSILKVLDELYNNGDTSIMVIMTVAISKADLDSGKYLQVVNAFKDHPAILMWTIGNEWNFNRLYGYGSLTDAAASVNLAAESIKAIDSHHPVASILGDAFENSGENACGQLWVLKDVIQLCPNIDIWGLNVYRGTSFNGLFLQWKSLWEQDLRQAAKPFYLSEFGIDSFNSTGYNSDGSCQARATNVTGSEDQQKQSDVDSALWIEIKSHLSSDTYGELCLGGLIHEFNDEIWKCGNFHVGLGGVVDYNSDHSYDDYNSEGFVLAGAMPDNVFNEEYFGLVSADRKPKLAYEKMKQEWVDTTAPITPVVTDSGEFTNRTGILSASWVSYDFESGIAEYKYKITQDSAAGSVVKDWTSTGKTAFVSATGLSLTNGKTYYFSVKAVNNANVESDVGYSDGITVSLVSGADLEMTQLSVNVPMVAIGGKIALTNSVANNGNSTSGGFYVGYRLSLNSIYGDSDDIAFTSKRYVSSLAAGAELQAITNLTIPATVIPGAYYIFAKADVNGAITENNEGNNVLSTASAINVTLPLRADMVINSMTTAVTNISPGKYVSVSTTVANQGEAASKFCYVSFSLSKDKTYGGADDIVLTTKRSISALAVGVSSTGTTSLLIPSSVSLGSYYICAKVDSTGVVAELNENNNLASINATLIIN